MVSSFTPNKEIEQPAHGDYVDSWQVPVNADWEDIDNAFGGIATKNATGLSGNQALAVADYQPLAIRITGAPTGAINYRVPSGVGGMWVARNDTTGGQTVTFSSAAGGSAVAIAVGTNTLITCDGTARGMLLAITTPGPAGGSTTQVQFNSSGVLGGSANLTWNGTTLTSTGLSVTGNTALGDASGDTLTINARLWSAPNNININTSDLFLNATNGRVGIGTDTPSSLLTVVGVIESTSGGVKFPDGTTQTSAFNATTQNVSAVTSINFIGVASNINNLEFDCSFSVSAADTIMIQFYDSGGTLDTAGNYSFQSLYAFGPTVAAANFGSLGAITLGGVGTLQPATLNVWVNNIQRVARTMLNYQLGGVTQDSTENIIIVGMGGRTSANGPITGVRITTLTGTTTLTGRATMYTSI